MSAIWDGLQSVLGGIVSFFYGMMPNLGVAIILLTIVVGIAMFPLTLKQTRSMRAMQEMQPEIKRLQAELKHDRQALQQATMEMYKERGVNPAAGCLPMILQMPIWFALFSVLRSFASTDPAKYVIESSRLARDLVATPPEGIFFLGMDLTVTPRVAFDQGVVGSIPYLVTILVVMATAYYQQRQMMARSQQQGQQQPPGQAIMKIFPFFFGFISFQMPAGLVVYFAASQIFRIGQQALIISLDERKAEKEPRKPGSDVKKAADPEPGEGQKSGGTTPEGRKPTRGRRPAEQPVQSRSPQSSKKRRGKKRRRK